METRPSTSKGRCRHCGAEVNANARFCWLCGESLAPATGREPVLVAELVESDRPLQFGIASLLLVITFVAVLCSLIKMNPGLGIVIAVLTLPAMIRTVLSAFRRREAGRPMSGGDKASTFLSTVAMSICAIVAAGVTFCGAFVATCLVAMGTTGGRSFEVMLPWMVCVGGIAAIIVAGIVSYAFLAMSRRKRLR